MIETEDGLELRELDETVTKKDSDKADRVGAWISGRRQELTGHAEETVVSSCHYCRQGLSEGAVPLSVSRQLVALHLAEKHPEKKPRSQRQVIDDFEKQQGELKREQEKRREAEKKAARKKQPLVSRPKRITRSRQKRQQPELTDEMVEEIKSLHEQEDSITRLAEKHYARFGFSSARAFRNAVSKRFHEQDIPFAKPRCKPWMTEEMEIEAIRLCEEERWSVREIARERHAAWGYSENGLRNRLRRLFDERGVDYRKIPRRRAQRQSMHNYLTPERLEVVSNLYFLGNYYLKEITEMVSGVWGHVGHNTLNQALRRNGYKLRAGRWDNDGSRPISKREALKMIKAVS